MVILMVIGIIICVCLSALFSSSEMSILSSNTIRLENLMDEGDEGAKLALKASEDYDNTLSTILIGNNLVNIAASSLGSVLVITLLSEKDVWISTLVITLLVIVFGETIPKIVAKKNATNIARFVSRPITFLKVIFKPVTWIVVKLVELITKPLKEDKVDEDDRVSEELHTLIETAEDEDVLDEESSELVSAAIDFADISVSEVMTARVDITAIDIDDDFDEIMEIVNNSPYSRLPVYRDSIDNVIGIISMNHFLKSCLDNKPVNIEELLMQPYFVYKTMKLPDVLEMLKDSQQHLAIVTDEYGGTLGVVTLEDVLEEIVGEIWDETDVIEDEISEKEDGVYEIDGDTLVEEMMELLGWDQDQFDFESETVGGWCIEYLGEFPKINQTFDYLDANFTILEVDERRVMKVLVRQKKGEE